MGSEYIFWVLITVFTLLLSSIAFFLKDFVRKIENLTQKVELLNNSFSAYVEKHNHLEEKIRENKDGVERLRKRCHEFESKFNSFEIKMERLKH